MDHTDPLPSRLDAARSLWRLYETATFPQRTLAALRPFICPLSPVLEQIPPGVRVLDIGSGNGLFLSAMASVRNIAVGNGAEVSARAIEAAQAQASGEPVLTTGGAIRQACLGAASDAAATRRRGWPAAWATAGARRAGMRMGRGRSAAPSAPSS
jgi:SAM-dependent methyltransferase